MPTSDWTPSVSSVGAIMRSRTRDSNGNEVGTFTSLTTPTDAQVTEMVTTALGVVSGVVGSDIPQKLWEQAKAVAVLRTAMSIELSYFPEQVAIGRSPYAQYREMYLDELRALTAAIVTSGADAPGDGNGTGGFAAPPAYGFPSPVVPLDPLLVYGQKYGTVYGPQQPYDPPAYGGGLFQ